MIFPSQYLIRYKSNELKCNRFKSWYSRKFAETFSSIPGVITPPTILKQYGIRKKHSLIKFTVVDTHDYVSPISRDIIDTAEEVASTKKPFTFIRKNLKLWHYASWIYTAGYILQLLITRRNYFWILQNVLLKYNYAHLVTNCWFGCWNFSTFDAFACSLGKPIYWSLDFEIFFEFVSTFFIRNFKK